ncbi:MAG: ABC transporter permease [Proteobacteria bacterium]|nr:ABC transporter permease [Pseudomonadota bacterium]MBU1698366.1 ABC transporter permease [Pseudomonadota bacterium]
MFLFLCKRFLGLIVLLIALSTLVFFFTRSLPGDMAALYIGGNAKAEQIERARIELGLDKPIIVQYKRYMERLIHADMGISLRTHRPVFKDLMEKIPMSFELVFWALLIATFFGVSFGVTAAYFHGSFIDEIIKWLTSAAVSLPIFFLALLLQLLFFNYLGWFPLQGRLDSFLEFTNPIESITGFSMIDTLVTGNFKAFFNVTWHMVLPVVALCVSPWGIIARLTRSSLLDIMEQDYILAARASGISESVLFFYYGLRNALSPVLTVIGLSVALILLATFYVEMIFNWPGIGYYSLAAIISLDYTALMGVTLMIGTVYVIANTTMDILRRVVDPRIK